MAVHGYGSKREAWSYVVIPSHTQSFVGKIESCRAVGGKRLFLTNGGSRALTFGPGAAWKTPWCMCHGKVSQLFDILQGVNPRHLHRG